MNIDADKIIEGIKKDKPSIAVERSEEAEITLTLPLLTANDPISPGELDRVKTTVSENRENLLQAHCRDGIQFLLNTVFKLPIKSSDDGPIAQLPALDPGTLPRAKPLPKKKPMTKWESFAAKKGIQKRGKKDRVIFDEEKKEWVPKWGYKGKNKDSEQQWLTPIPAGKDANFNPVIEERKKRKDRIKKNETQRLRNIQRNIKPTSQTQSTNSARKDEIQKALKATRKSTASLGRFDKMQEGDSKLNKGIRRKFDDNLDGSESRKSRDIAIASSVIKGGKGEVNVRKAINHVSRGMGAASLAGNDSRPSKKRRR